MSVCHLHYLSIPNRTKFSVPQSCDGATVQIVEHGTTLVVLAISRAPENHPFEKRNEEKN